MSPTSVDIALAGQSSQPKLSSISRYLACTRGCVVRQEVLYDLHTDFQHMYVWRMFTIDHV